MSNRALLERIAECGRTVLANGGFRQVGDLVFEKELPGLVQGIEFLRGTGSRKGSFTVNLYWRFTHNPRVKEDAMDFWQRLGVFLSGVDEWYRSSADRLEETFAWLSGVFAERVLPFFARFQSIESILKTYESGEVDEALLFGIDAGWREYNLGYAYLFVGDEVKAAQHLRRVVEAFSATQHDWVQERRQTVEKALAQMASR